MKPGAARFLSALLMVALTGASAVHAEPAKPATYTFEEVSEAEAQQVAPLPRNFWKDYQEAGASRIAMPQVQSLATTTIIVGTIALDAIVNIGKTLWNMIEAGRPKINLDMDVASAVPQGITSWAELDSWKDPVAKLYKTQLYSSHQRYLGDVYYRLVYTYGGHYQGVGNYLTNVTVLPAQLKISYNRNFYAYTKVTELVNHGTTKDPIAGMSLLLAWGLNSLGSQTMQSVSLHVRGDGGVTVLPAANDSAETVKAPVKVTKAPIKIEVPETAPSPSPLDEAQD
jgi:hypothetical protein